jgi:hypothetical protein
MTKKPLNTCIFCLPGHGYIFTSYFFEKKIKETPNSKVKILCPKWQIRIYIVAKKKLIIPFYPRSFYQCQVHLIRKTIIPPTTCLASFFGRDNSVITLLQFTIICI